MGIFQERKKNALFFSKHNSDKSNYNNIKIKQYKTN